MTAAEMIPELVLEQAFEFAISASIGGDDVIPEADFSRREIQDALQGRGRLAFLEDKFRTPIANAATGTNASLFGSDAELISDHCNEIISVYVSGFYVGAIATGLHGRPLTVDILMDSDPSEVIKGIAVELEEMDKGLRPPTIPGTLFPIQSMATKFKPALFLAPLVASYFKAVLGVEPDMSMIDICQEVSSELISVFSYGAAYAVAVGQARHSEGKVDE